MAKRILVLALALSIFYFTFGAEENDRKPYYIKKSSFCLSSQSAANSYLCDGKSDFKDAIKQIINSNEKLSKSGKVGEQADTCSNALKNAICSKSSPLCLEGDGESEARRICEKLRGDCPALSDDRCDAYMQRKFINLTCVSIGKDQKFEGYCPKPTRKMPASYLVAYKLKSNELQGPMRYLESANKLAGMKLLSGDCMQKIKDAACMPLYCSDDEKNVIVPNKQNECNAVLECIGKVFDKYDKVEVLNPVKGYLTGGCDKIIQAIKTSASSSNDAYSISHTHRFGLFLIAIHLVFTY